MRSTSFLDRVADLQLSEDGCSVLTEGVFNYGVELLSLNICFCFSSNALLFISFITCLGSLIAINPGWLQTPGGDQAIHNDTTMTGGGASAICLWALAALFSPLLFSFLQKK